MTRSGRSRDSLALSVSRRLPPLETVIMGHGICSRVRGLHLRKYMHIHTKSMQIHRIHTYTYIYIHKHTYTTSMLLMQCMYIGNSNIHADTCIYVHIHTYTYSWRIFFQSTYISDLYVHILHIGAYTCSVKNGVFVRVPKKMHVYCMYFDVFVRILFSILYVFCMYTRVLYVYCSIDATSNFPYRKYVNIRVYLHIHAIYDTHTYNILHNILQYTYKINQ